MVSQQPFNMLFLAREYSTGIGDKNNSQLLLYSIKEILTFTVYANTVKLPRQMDPTLIT